MDGGMLGQVRPPQSIFAQSAQKQGELGFHLPFNDGRMYVYSRDGGSGLTMGNLVQAGAVESTADLNIAVQTAGRAIDAFLKVTITSGHGTFVANQHEGGFLLIDHHTEEGLMRRIKSHGLHTYGTASTITFKFKDVLGEAVAISTHTCKLLANIYNLVKTNVGVTGGASNTGKCVGVAPIDVTANYYFWLQVRGLGPGIYDGSPSTTINPGIALTCAAEKVARPLALGDPVIGQSASFGSSENKSIMVWYTFE